MKIHNQGSNNFNFLCCGKPKAISAFGKLIFSCSETLHMHFVVSDIPCQFNKTQPFLLLDVRLHILKNHLISWFYGLCAMLNCKVSSCKFICFCALGSIYLKSSIVSSLNCKEEEIIHKEHKWRQCIFCHTFWRVCSFFSYNHTIISHWEGHKSGKTMLHWLV